MAVLVVAVVVVAVVVIAVVEAAMVVVVIVVVMVIVIIIIVMVVAVRCGAAVRRLHSAFRSHTAVASLDALCACASVAKARSLNVCYGLVLPPLMAYVFLHVLLTATFLLHVVRANSEVQRALFETSVLDLLHFLS